LCFRKSHPERIKVLSHKFALRSDVGVIESSRQLVNPHGQSDPQSLLAEPSCWLIKVGGEL
jgi:hypothetical protein